MIIKRYADRLLTSMSWPSLNVNYIMISVYANYRILMMTCDNTFELLILFKCWQWRATQWSIQILHIADVWTLQTTCSKAILTNGRGGGREEGGDRQIQVFCLLSFKLYWKKFVLTFWNIFLYNHFVKIWQNTTVEWKLIWNNDQTEVARFFKPLFGSLVITSSPFYFDLFVNNLQGDYLTLICLPY